MSGRPDFRVRLDNADDATIIYALSDDVAAMLACFEGPSDGSKNRGKCIAPAPEATYLGLTKVMGRPCMRS